MPRHCHSSESWNPGLSLRRQGSRFVSSPLLSFRRRTESRPRSSGGWNPGPPAVIPAKAGIQVRLTNLINYDIQKLDIFTIK